MARGQSKDKITTLGSDRVFKALQVANIRESISCEMIAGFHVVKLKNGSSYRYRYTDDLGKRRVYTVGDFNSIKPNEAAEIVRQIKLGDIDPLTTKQERKAEAQKKAQTEKSSSLKAYLINDYARHMEAWEPDSAKQTTQRISNNFAHILNKSMADIDRPDIRVWQTAIEDKGRAYSTIQRSYGSLNALLNQAVADEVITSNPLKSIKLLPPKKEEQERLSDQERKEDRRMLTSEELESLFKGLDELAKITKEKRANSIKRGKPQLESLARRKLPHWFIPFTHLALHTGLRTGDLFSLTWRELDIKNGKLLKYPNKTKSKALRSGRKPALVDMPLNSTIQKIMTTWQKEQTSKSDLVFPSSVTGLRMDKSAHKKPWEQVKKLGKLDCDLLFYSFRHNFISTLVSKGLPLLAVAKLAGQKDIKMIQEHYGHLSPDQAQQAVNILESSITNGKEAI